MIIDTLANLARYESLNPHFKQAFDFLKKTDLSQLETGKKIILDGENSFINVNEGAGKEKPDAKLEQHRKYIDIQVPISMPETYGWKQGAKCSEVLKPYNPEKDIEFFSDEPTTYFTLNTDEFCIFFPEDGHAPGIGNGNLKKLIVKVIL
jgi:YhcH/YjgK/YiaL family protein